MKPLPSLPRPRAQRRLAELEHALAAIQRVGRIPVALGVIAAVIMCTGLATAAVRRDDQAQRHHASITAATTLPQRTAPTPTPTVAPLRKLVDPDVLVTSSAPLSPKALSKLSHLPGVTQAVTFAVGRTKIGNATLTTYAVDPSAFRAWTAAPTARSDGMWQSVAKGELTASFDAANELKLPLGGQVVLDGRHPVPLRLGAIATLGLPGADAVVSTARASELGLRPETGIVLTAPHANLRTLDTAAARTVGTHALVHSLHALPPVPVPPKPTQQAGIANGSAPAPQAQSQAAPSIPLPAINGTLAERVIAIAKSRIGAPYVYGASGPGAFDCSGFTSWVFGQVGIGLPRTAAEQWNAGPHVPYSQAQPGDILAWASDPTVPGYVSHVAIYLGNGMMIAAQHSGTVVSILPVYTGGLIGAVRFI